MASWPLAHRLLLARTQVRITGAVLIQVGVVVAAFLIPIADGLRSLAPGLALLLAPAVGLCFAALGLGLAAWPLGWLLGRWAGSAGGAEVLGSALVEGDPRLCRALEERIGSLSTRPPERLADDLAAGYFVLVVVLVLAVTVPEELAAGAGLGTLFLLPLLALASAALVSTIARVLFFGPLLRTASRMAGAERVLLHRLQALLPRDCKDGAIPLPSGSPPSPAGSPPAGTPPP